MSPWYWSGWNVQDIWQEAFATVIIHMEHVPKDLWCWRSALTNYEYGKSDIQIDITWFTGGVKSHVTCSLRRGCVNINSQFAWLIQMQIKRYPFPRVSGYKRRSDLNEVDITDCEVYIIFLSVYKKHMDISVFLISSQGMILTTLCKWIWVIDLYMSHLIQPMVGWHVSISKCSGQTLILSLSTSDR